MTTKSKTKKQLAILDDKPGDDALQLISRVEKIASFTKTPGETTQRPLFIAGPNQCYETNLLDVSGFAITGSNGQSQFLLTSFLCPLGDSIFHPVNVVATPLSAVPCFLTVMHSVVNNGTDVQIKVFAWNRNGAAAPKISFNWRCRTEIRRIIL